MATDQEKNVRRGSLWAMTVFGMTIGIWEMVEDSAGAISPYIGNALLPLIEKQLGLEIAGEKPADLITEIGRLFVDEFGFAAEAKVTATDKVVTLLLKNAMATKEGAQLAAMGVKKSFSHPAMCVGVAALTRAGVKCRGNVELDVPNNNQTVTFELL
jgi:hypothetical protein